MFTGIIEAVADVHSFEDGTLVVLRPSSFDDISIGSSISVSGVCLSIIALDGASLAFNVIPETLRKTAIGNLKKGNRVNLERAMTAGARFEGHIVQGHCENTGSVIAFRKEGEDVQLKIRVPGELCPHIISQGSITLDGVSLTIASVDNDIVTVALIPHTLKSTTFGAIKEGDRINIETDILEKFIASQKLVE